MNTEYGFNSQCLMKNGKPWFPVMGEIHFSRYRADLWEESLRKMKAGGVSIASVYVIWIHHEEEEGCFDFSGNRSLRGFLEAAGKVGISVFLRLGPWVHGEARNGGFPDWLQARKDIDLRSDEPAYLFYVRRFWEQLYEQAKGYLYADGGPVIGTQIENEYGHVGGYRGEKGEQHMRTLAALAREIGFDLPIFTATGWGGAVTGGLLPVMGGYCEAPWDQRITEIEPNANYVFSHIRNDALIASDHHVDDTITFRQEDFPYLTAELGGGVQVTKHRRPIASGPDIGAMSLAKLGSGVALLGYYMFHGGSNPDGKRSTLQESRETGYLNDLPEINYDFNAPIRQYGTISDNYREIRLLAYFLQDFGEDLAVLPADIEPAFVKPGDTHTLRLSCRHDDTHGYIFVNNYQRRLQMDEHRGVVLEGKRAGEPVHFPAIDIKPGEYGFYPYGMKLGNATLARALATPLCRLKTSAGDVFIFYGDRDPQFVWAGEPVDVLMLTRAQALQAARVCLDQEYLVLAEDFVWEKDKKLVVQGGKDTVIRTFPQLNQIPAGFEAQGRDGALYVYRRLKTGEASGVSVTRSVQTPSQLSGVLKNSCNQLVTLAQDSVIYDLTITYPEGEADRKSGRDRILSLNYACESMDLYMNGRKINDYFYTGQKALLSLGYFDFPDRLTAVLHPLYEGDPIYLQQWPEMENGTACRIEQAQIEEIYTE